MTDQYDFSGWATKNNLKCTDGRTILPDAFKGNDGMIVPLVWHHLHNEPDNVLGHALLENRPEGVYCYGKFNKTERGLISKVLVEHHDINFLSIFANGLIEQSKNVVHGMIREVSLVMAGANPGAVIDNLAISHSDGSEDTPVLEEAIIYTDTPLTVPEIAHAAEVVTAIKKEEPVADTTVAHAAAAAAAPADKTVGEIFDTFSEEQKQVVYALIAEVMDSSATDNTVAQSDTEEGETVMKHNAFDSATATAEDDRPTLSHAQFDEIRTDAVKKYGGSFKDSFLAHTASLGYGIDDIEYLFPDARAIAASPAFIQRKMAWVGVVMNGTFHSPFARIKSLTADITADDARARGYVKGAEKTEEIIKMLKRETTPTTIYKKQKLDRDDVVDITDLDIVAWLKAEMRVMLDEEVARAILIGDGRDPASPDKVNEARIRPIYKDDDMYVERVQLEEDADGEDMIEGVIRARKTYNGSGSPTMFVNSDVLSDMLLLKDTTGRRLYSTQAELETVLRVSSIVEVPVMSNVQRTTDEDVDLDLLAIIVNLKDYTVGADKGGQLGMFDDFDIDFNQYKYLMETRISGALVLPKSAIIVERVAAAG